MLQLTKSVLDLGCQESSNDAHRCVQTPKLHTRASRNPRRSLPTRTIQLLVDEEMGTLERSQGSIKTIPNHPLRAPTQPRNGCQGLQETVGKAGRHRGDTLQTPSAETRPHCPRASERRTSTTSTAAHNEAFKYTQPKCDDLAMSFTTLCFFVIFQNRPQEPCQLLCTRGQ